jgi:L-alanine-DL-glutamate epimerase-like enolase superfamily enzyme
VSNVSVSLYQRLAELELTVDGYDLERLELQVDRDWVRVTTVIRLAGAGEHGLGEDVTYEAEDQNVQQRDGGKLDVAGRYTLRRFSRRLDALELFPRPPIHEAARHYRRWAWEAAALDLALRQNGLSFADALGIEPSPVRFVASPRLGRPPTAAPLRRLLAIHPDLEFKLDAGREWTPALIAELAATGAVRIVDFKGHYEGTVVDQAAEPELYRLVLAGLPEAWIEDPHDHRAVHALLAPHRERIAWDAPIHRVDDLARRPFPVRVVNIKPSRFGTLERLLAAYDHCAEQGTRIYGGGQFELGPGRGQIQYLASLFHPDAPNDVAPRAYHATRDEGLLPGSPLTPHPTETGFRWED